MKTKIEIKDLYGNALFTHEQEGNSAKETVEEAVRQNVRLRGADLGGADLRGACLGDADLGGADLRDADLRGADLGGADLCDADLRDADLRDACLGGADLRGADLGGAYLRGACLRDARLRDARLRDADLGGAYLHGACLGGADLRYADLRDACLGDADLGGADLRDADLGGADLCDADLRDACLRGAYLGGAYLDGAKNIPFIPLACPSDGAFIGWKKVNKCIVKLLIPEDAKRSSATTNKCRCDKAKVLEITSMETNEHLVEIINTNTEYAPCVYKVGEMAYPDSFNDNRWNECSHGIHFFINRQEAVEY